MVRSGDRELDISKESDATSFVMKTMRVVILKVVEETEKKEAEAH